jgi:hypothetical protein
MDEAPDRRVLIRLERGVNLTQDVFVHAFGSRLNSLSEHPGFYRWLGSEYQIVDTRDLDKIPSDAYVILGEFDG